MTATTAHPPAVKERSFAERGPVGRAYRRYLVRASLTMFALIIVSAYLLPLLYMVTTALQQPGQSATPGAPIYPAVPQTGIYEGVEYPVYSVPIDGTTRQLLLVDKGRESSTFVDPIDNEKSQSRRQLFDGPRKVPTDPCSFGEQTPCP